MRHGEAENTVSAPPDDFHRKLTPTGLEASYRMGLALERYGVIPDMIVSSEALRAGASARQVVLALKLGDVVRSNSRLYEASAPVYLTEIQQLPAEITTALVVGHNPGISQAAHTLWSSGAAVGNFPPAGLACFVFDIASWDAVNPQAGRCRWFTTPEQEHR